MKREGNHHKESFSPSHIKGLPCVTLQEENDKPEATRYFYGDNEDKSLVQELNWLHADTKLKISKTPKLRFSGLLLHFLFHHLTPMKYKKESDEGKSVITFGNMSEGLFQHECLKRNIKISKRGYPDFAIIKNDEIVGFVEVKKRSYVELKKEQSMFQLLCEKHGIPFSKWTPDDNFPNWI